MFFRRKSKKRVNFFNPKNLLIFILVGAAFSYLYKYRYNDPLPVTTIVKNFKISTLDNQQFNLTDINIPKAIIFFDPKNIYSPYYLKILPQLKILNDSGKLYLLVFLDEDKNDILKLINKRKYKVLENITYLTNIKNLNKYFGVRSYPHFFLLNSQNKIVYEAKLPPMREVRAIIGESL
jgi:hypothetical protein